LTGSSAASSPSEADPEAKELALMSTISRT
jgi:hypothetical protein